MTTESAPIEAQVDEFNVGFNEQIGPRLAAVFQREQAELTAEGAPAHAAGIGDTVPDAPLITLEGRQVRLSDVQGGGPAVLVFYRGAWCPYCNITLRTYQRDLLPGLQEAGVRLIAISPQTQEGSQQIAQGAELGFPVLSDPGTVLIRRLGILTEPSTEAREAHTDLGFDVADSNADATAGIPFPTVLIVDGDRTVRFADVHVDYTTRTEPAAVLAAVGQLLEAQSAR